MAKKSLVEGINLVRSVSSENYRNNVPELTEDSSITKLSTPLLTFPNLMNEFIDVLVQRLVYTKFEIKNFNNPLKFLEGDNLPLGYIGQEIYVNPAQGRDYKIDDFAGLLQKYESDVKVQYQKINFDKQYPVTVIREKLKQAFVSFEALEDFIGNITNSLYNGAYIDEYNATKNLVGNAYRGNNVQIKVINAINSESVAKEFITLARTLFLNFQAPSDQYNAWQKIGGYGRAIMTFTDKQDIVFLIRNDILSYIDVNILASAFNISSTDLMGKIIGVPDFNQYDKEGNLIFDGSNIYGIMCDKSWFRIKTQDMYMEDFRNANNRSMQYYLNLIKMFSFSYFANAVVFATKEPDVTITNLDFNAPEGVTIEGIGTKEKLDVLVTPNNATTPEIEFTSGNTSYFTVEKDTNNERRAIVTAVGAGTAKLTAKAGNVTAEVNITVTE